ncbi:MAG: hypothetical protein OXI60_05260 [Acidiferrobacterales bacterium]|nr:hypothetical protein [Acidiferrobacterales bacterium]
MIRSHRIDARCIRHYKRLCQVERAFRTILTGNLKVRPVHHRTEDRVRAHIFLCTLACYVEWRMREAYPESSFQVIHPENYLELIGLER